MDAIELFNRKKECFAKVRDMTKNARLSSTVDSTELYVALINMREEIFSEVADLDKKITDILIEEKDTLQKVENIKKETKQIIQEIIKLDENNKEITQIILQELKKGLQEVHKGKESSKIYNHDLIYAGVSRFDSKG